MVSSIAILLKERFLINQFYPWRLVFGIERQNSIEFIIETINIHQNNTMRQVAPYNYKKNNEFETIKF